MIPRLVPEISPLDAFCDVVAGVVVVVAGIGDSRSWILKNVNYVFQRAEEGAPLTSIKVF